MRALVFTIALTACNSGDADVSTCQSSCDDGKFFDCLTATEQLACRTRCESTSGGTRSDFVACQDASLPTCDRTCYALLGLTVAGGPDGGTTCAGGDVTVCQQSCDTIHFYGCFDATMLQTCRARCTTSSSVACRDFGACVGAEVSCDVLLDCWNQF